MYDYDERRREGASPFSSFLRRDQRRRVGPALAVGFAIAVLAGVGWYVLGARDSGPPIPAQQQPPSPAPANTPPLSSAPLDSVEPLELPPLDASDEFVRRLVAALSAHPQFASWLVTDEMVHRFVATIVDLAHGSSPARHLRFMAPPGAFAVRESDGAGIIDPASYRRYDTITAVFVSLDTPGTARLVRQLDPLFNEVHREMGFPDGTFARDLERAISNMLAINIDDAPPTVVQADAGWEWRDPALEARSAAAKHLMRMGPQNARRVQAKLNELAAVLGIRRTGDPVDAPPGS